jgi:PAS domain S-box-containing protein
MNDDDLGTLPAPTTYEDAEAILQKLSHVRADKVWTGLSEDGAEVLLRSLAPALPRRVLPSIAPAPPTTKPGDPAEEKPPSERTLPRLSEKILLDVLETAPDAVVVIDGQGVIVLVNAQTEKMFGYSRQELLGKERVEILVPLRHRAQHVHQRRGYFAAPHLRAMGSGLPLFGLRKDGYEFPVEISLSPLETEEGILVISVIRDVTERREREAALAKAEARYRSLVEEIPAVTFVAPFDEDVGELYVSPQIVDLLGFTQEEWLNDPVLWYRQLHPEDRERWHQEFARTCATAQPFRSVYRFVARKGHTVWVHGEAKVVRDKAGRPMFLQGVAFDITRMKNAEEELKRLNENLEKRVADRTELLTSYANQVHHDIQKPLHRIDYIIKGPADRSRPKKTAEKRFQEIGLAVKDAQELSDGMLKFALATEKAKEFTPTNCTMLVRAVREELQVDIQESGATVSFRGLPTVLAHRESLKLVFRNLIGNAIKYRAGRLLKVHVSAERQDAAWLFRVRDNGLGIRRYHPHKPDVDRWERIFELGVGSRQHTERDGVKIPGHGIGLSYCRRVIEHHGGKIWVQSEYGKGSTFFFTLPAEVETAPDDPGRQG